MPAEPGTAAPPEQVQSPPPGRSGSLTHRPAVGLALAVVLLAVMCAGFLRLQQEHAALPAIARYALTTALPDWNTTEPVNEVVYGSRGFDTFGETFLLLAAVVSIGVLTRRREPRAEQAGESAAGRREQEHADPAETASPDEELARSAEQREEGDGPTRPESPEATGLGEPAPERAPGMTVVVQVGVRVAVPVLSVAAVYLCAWGYSPGGGFPAGAALSGVVLLLYTAFGYPRMRRALGIELTERIELAGAAAIVAIEVIGLIAKGSVSANWIPLAPAGTIRSGGVLQAFSVAELVEVGTGLILAIVALLRMRHDWSPDEADDTGNDTGNDTADGTADGTADDSVDARADGR